MFIAYAKPDSGRVDLRPWEYHLCALVNLLIIYFGIVERPAPGCMISSEETSAYKKAGYIVRILLRHPAHI